MTTVNTTTDNQKNDNNNNDSIKQSEKISTKNIIKIVVCITILAAMLVSRIVYVRFQDVSDPFESTIDVSLPVLDSDVAVEIDGVPDGLVVGVVVSYMETIFHPELVDEGLGWNKNGEGVSVARWRLEQAGTNITLGVVSDNGTEDGARAAVSQLVEDGAGAIIALTSGDHTKALAEEAAKSRIPVIFPYEPWFETEANAYFYNPSHQNTAKTMIQHAQTLGCDNAFLLTTSEEFNVHITLANQDIDGFTIGASYGVRSNYTFDAKSLTAIMNFVAEEINSQNEAANVDTSNNTSSVSGEIDETQSGIQSGTQNGGQSGGQYDSGSQDVGEEPFECILMDAAGEDLAAFVIKLRENGVDLPIITTNEAQNYRFYETIHDNNGYSSLTEVYSIGGADNYSLALGTGSEAERVNAGVFNYAITLMKQNTEITSLFADITFKEYGSYADMASHDALIAIVIAAANANSTNPQDIATALNELELSPKSAPISTALDFTNQNQPVRETYLIQATTNTAIDASIDVNANTNTGAGMDTEQSTDMETKQSAGIDTSANVNANTDVNTNINENNANTNADTNTNTNADADMDATTSTNTSTDVEMYTNTASRVVWEPVN